MGRARARAKDAGVVDTVTDWRVDPVGYTCGGSRGDGNLSWSAMEALKHCFASQGTQDAVETAVHAVEAAIIGVGKGRQKGTKAETLLLLQAVSFEAPGFADVVSAVFVAVGGAGRAARRLFMKVLIGTTRVAPFAAAQLHAAELRQIFATTLIAGAGAGAGAGGSTTTDELEALLRCISTVLNVLDAPPNIATAAMSEQGVLNSWLSVLNKAMAIVTLGAEGKQKDLKLVCRATMCTFQKVDSCFEMLLSPLAGAASSGIAAHVVETETSTDAPRTAAAAAAASNPKERLVQNLETELHSIGNALKTIVTNASYGTDSILLAGMAEGYLLKLTKWLSTAEQAAAVHAVLFNEQNCNGDPSKPSKHKSNIVQKVPWLVPLAEQNSALSAHLPEIAELAAIRAAMLFITGFVNVFDCLGAGLWMILMGFVVAGLEAPTCLLFCKTEKTEGACTRLTSFVTLFTGISRAVFYTLGCIPMFFCEMHFSIVLTVLVLLGSVFFYFMEWLAPSPDQPKDGDVINEDLLTDEERAEAGAAGPIAIDEGGNSWDRFVGGAVDAAAKAAAPAIAAAAVSQMTGQLTNPFGTSASGNIGDGAANSSKSPSSNPTRSKAGGGGGGNPFANTSAAAPAPDPTGNPFANPFTGNIAAPSPSAPQEPDTEGNPFMAK